MEYLGHPSYFPNTKRIYRPGSLFETARCSLYLFKAPLIKRDFNKLMHSANTEHAPLLLRSVFDLFSIRIHRSDGGNLNNTCYDAPRIDARLRQYLPKIIFASLVVNNGGRVPELLSCWSDGVSGLTLVAGTFQFA